jgi:hypothetical protein
VASIKVGWRDTTISIPNTAISPQERIFLYIPAIDDRFHIL